MEEKAAVTTAPKKKKKNIFYTCPQKQDQRKPITPLILHNYPSSSTYLGPDQHRSSDLPLPATSSSESRSHPCHNPE